MAFENTYAWIMTNYREAEILNATKVVRRLIGINMPKEQWKIEVDGIFNATLAAMQIHMYDYARGTYADAPNTIETTPSRLKDSKSNIPAAVDISKMIKFRNSAYRNVSAVWFWTTNGLCVLLFLGSRKFSTQQRREALLRRNRDGGFHDYLWIVISCVAVANIIKRWAFGMISWITTRPRTRSPGTLEPNRGNALLSTGEGGYDNTMNGSAESGARDHDLERGPSIHEEGNAETPPHRIEEARDDDFDSLDIRAEDSTE
jgi:hypothetical protein